MKILKWGAVILTTSLIAVVVAGGIKYNIIEKGTFIHRYAEDNNIKVETYLSDKKMNEHIENGLDVNSIITTKEYIVTLAKGSLKLKPDYSSVKEVGVTVVKDLSAKTSDNKIVFSDEAVKEICRTLNDKGNDNTSTSDINNTESIKIGKTYLNKSEVIFLEEYLDSIKSYTETLEKYNIYENYIVMKDYNMGTLTSDNPKIFVTSLLPTGETLQIEIGKNKDFQILIRQ